MRNLPVAISVAAILLSTFSFFYFKSHHTKIGYVETNRLLTDYVGMKQASSELKHSRNIWSKQLDTLRTELENMINENSLLTKKEQEEKKELIESKRKELYRFQQNIEEKSIQEEQQLTQGVVTRIDGFIKKFGKDNGYTMIFATSSSGGMVYGDGAVNLTKQILTGLNKQHESN